MPPVFMTRLPSSRRLWLRLQGKPSSDPRDVLRRLRKALERGSSRATAHHGQAEQVQLFGEVLSPKQYGQWARKRRGGTPELTHGRYALVLHAIPPGHVERFLRRHTYTELLGPPHVGMFEPTVEAEDALAGTVAAWLERQSERPVAPAPPMLRTYTAARQEDRVVDFGLPWPLEPQRLS